MSDPLRVGVLASGTGSNLQALLDRVHGQGEVEIVVVGSDRPDAKALERARNAGVATRSFPVDEHAHRAARDAAMADWLQDNGVELVVLAGYMQLLSPAFIARFPDAVINVHPALLPAFPGLRAVEQALAYGVKLIGVTVHYVDEGVDSGPVILQRSMELHELEDLDAVMQRVHAIEHELLPEAVLLFARGALSRDPDHPRWVRVNPERANRRR
jgi:phosphoribosylglycinamide formyltransferase-1